MTMTILHPEMPPATCAATLPSDALRAVRRAAEDEIERLIALLDAIDPDPDLEDDPYLEEEGLDEPWLGAPERSAIRGQAPWAAGWDDDREREDEHDEPDLGALEIVDQSRWGALASDLEDEFDGREPSFGSACGPDGDELESDPAEAGIADDDALAEVYGRTW